LEGGASN